MERSTALQYEHKVPLPHVAWPQGLQHDPRWQLAQRVVAGSLFAKSPLLSKFLLHVVAKTLEGRGAEITEHQIGVQVFDRQPGYSTTEDNIVRNYARQLRKRLTEHFADEGREEPLRIDIPLGGYIPTFVEVSEKGEAQDSRRPNIAAGTLGDESLTAISSAGPINPKTFKWKRWLLRVPLAMAYSVLLIGVTWYAANYHSQQPQIQSPVHPLWKAIFNGAANTFIVPADAGFNLLEDLSRRPLPLADYMQGGYLQLPLAGVDAHSAEDLRSQEFTSFVDLEIVSALSRLPEYNPQRAFLRFPRDLRFDDLKNANAVLIGSVGSNPWSSIADSAADFRIVYGPGMRGATIINTRPQPGEAASYASHWNEPAHETFALIAFLPNLGGTGHLLLLQGLDVAGTEAAAETLFHQEAISTVLQRATRSDGSLRHFEILLRSTSIESNSTGTQVIATRIY